MPYNYIRMIGGGNLRALTVRQIRFIEGRITTLQLILVYKRKPNGGIMM